MNGLFTLNSFLSDKATLFKTIDTLNLITYFEYLIVESVSNYK